MLIFVLQNRMSVPDLIRLLDVVYYFFIISALVAGAYLVYKRLVLFGYKKKTVSAFIFLSFIFTIPAAYLSSRLANIFYYSYKLWDFNFFIEKTFYTKVHTYHASIILPIILISILTVVYRLHYAKTADTFFLYFPLVHAIGRTGCLLAGCCWGKNITLNISGENIVFTNPVPLYAILVNIILFILLRWHYNKLYKYKKNNAGKSGSVVAMYLGLYGIIRFITELFRTEKIVVGSFTQAQIAMILFMITSVLIYVKIFKTLSKNL